MGALIAIIVVVVVVLIIVFFLWGTYNGLAKARIRVKEAWSGIDVQLKRRVEPDPEPRRDREGLRRRTSARRSKT